jgi:hypothetical protein
MFFFNPIHAHADNENAQLQSESKANTGNGSMPEDMDEEEYEDIIHITSFSLKQDDQEEHGRGNSRPCVQLLTRRDPQYVLRCFNEHTNILTIAKWTSLKHLYSYEEKEVAKMAKNQVSISHLIPNQQLLTAGAGREEEVQPPASKLHAYQV